MEKCTPAICTAATLSLIFFFMQPAVSSSDDFERGFKLLNAGKYPDALNLLDKGVDAEPTNGKFHFWRGKCLAALGKSKEAVAEFKLAALLTNDAKIKESCKAELARYHKNLPLGSVHESSGKVSDATEDKYLQKDNLFKLSSKKLDWNLEMRKDFLKSMFEKNARLDSLARDGGRWRMPAAASHNVPLDLAAALHDGPAHFSIPLTADERSAISRSDVCIILDHSGSMNGLDCPARANGFQSRLGWCVDELESFAGDLCNAFPHGFYLISFDAKPDVHHITSQSTLRQTLDGIKIGGGTDLAAALGEAFRLHTAHPQQPLLIAVLTDAEIDLRSCERSIVEATRRFPKPNGIFVSLMQIGAVAEVHTSDTLRQLDNLDTSAGAAYDAVRGIPFSQLRKDGLGRDLLIGMRARSSAATSGEGAASKNQAISGGASSGSGAQTESKKQESESKEKQKDGSSGQSAPSTVKDKSLPLMWSPPGK